MTDTALIEKARTLGLHEAAAHFANALDIRRMPGHNKNWKPRITKGELQRMVVNVPSLS